MGFLFISAYWVEVRVRPNFLAIYILQNINQNRGTPPEFCSSPAKHAEEVVPLVEGDIIFYYFKDI